MTYTVLTSFVSVSDTIRNCPKSEYYGNGYDAQESDRIQYLDEYLKNIDVKTVIIEHEYVDRNFIDDYCGYYARSFRDHPKKCVRLLFFSSRFEDTDLKGSVLDNGMEELKVRIKDSFLGYIVLRPIPGAHLGKVCLTTYPRENDKNIVFPLCKPYHAHFMGMTLTVPTVAFQEQDNIISACATSALWSAFHCIKGKVPDDVPSPYKITDIARRVFVESSPGNVIDKGLMPPQMAAVIYDSGLTPLLSGYISKSVLKAIVRAYLNVGIPVILGFTLAYEDETRPHKNSIGYIIGNHAVTVNGYRLADDIIPPAFSDDNPQVCNQKEKDVELHLLSSRIEEFYAHDDQIGPFASMEDRSEYWERLETRWNHYRDPEDKVDASINIVLIPCLNKIRIRFSLIINFIKRCNSVFAGLWRYFGKTLVWDPRIFCVNEFKESVANRSLYPGLDDNLRLKLLSRNLPRYMWVVDSYINEEDGLVPVVTYLFDATDMDSSDYLIYGVHHRCDIYDLYCEFLKDWSEPEVEKYISVQRKNRAVLKSLLTSYRGDNDENLWHP